MLRAPIDARHYRDLYSNLEARAEAGDKAAAEVKGVIDQAWKGVADAFKAQDYTADNSDAAEALVGFITCYFIESNPSFRPLFKAPLEFHTADDGDLTAVEVLRKIVNSGVTLGGHHRALALAAIRNADEGRADD